MLCHGRELDVRRHQVRDEGDASSQAIQLRDNEDGTMAPVQAQGLGETRAIVPLTTLNLHHLGHELPAPAVEARADGFLLRLEAVNRTSLLLGRDTVVGDELPLRHSRTGETQQNRDVRGGTTSVVVNVTAWKLPSSLLSCVDVPGRRGRGP